MISSHLDFLSLVAHQAFGPTVKTLLAALQGDMSCARDPFPHLRSSFIGNVDADISSPSTCLHSGCDALAGDEPFTSSC